MGEIADVNMASLGGYLHSLREGPDGRKGSKTNSMAMCSILRGMVSVSLYFAQWISVKTGAHLHNDIYCETPHHVMKTSNHTIPETGCKIICGAPTTLVVKG